ncbi:MAG: hypothetical protein HC915_19890 [Anaerolineae bacterium]|nr:hypothetical protein [Anaerolineae bacterium]
MLRVARQLTIERLMIAILFILLFVMAVRVPVDTDTWWHLRSGEWMLDEGRLLREDRFSHTRAGEVWINHSWGGQLILTLFYRATGGDGAINDGGVVGLALFTALLGAGGMVLVYQMCPGNIFSKAFVMVFGTAAAAVFWSPRPQMFSFFLSAALLYLLYLYKWRGVDRTWLIPWLMALWVNLHAGYIIGFILLGGFWAGEALAHVLHPADDVRLSLRQLLQLAGLTLLAVLALALNPFGPRMILYPFETAGLQTLNLFIQEWQSPNFKIPSTWGFLLLLGGVLGLALLSEKRLAWSDISLMLGTLWLALWAGRNIALFAVVATPVLARLVDDFLMQRGWKLTPSRRPVRGARLALNWVLLGGGGAGRHPQSDGRFAARQRGRGASRIAACGCRRLFSGQPARRTAAQLLQLGRVADLPAARDAGFCGWPHRSLRRRFSAGVLPGLSGGFRVARPAERLRHSDCAAGSRNRAFDPAARVHNVAHCLSG